MELAGLSTAVTGLSVIITVAGLLLALVAAAAGVVVAGPHRRRRLARRESLRAYWSARLHTPRHA